MRALIFFFAVLIASCGMNRSDRDIESELDLSIRAAAPGVVMTVKNGVVTLSGTCPDESCRHTTEMNAKKTKGVKEVVNNIIISTPPAPGSAALKQ